MATMKAVSFSYQSAETKHPTDAILRELTRPKSNGNKITLGDTNELGIQRRIAPRKSCSPTAILYSGHHRRQKRSGRSSAKSMLFTSSVEVATGIFAADMEIDLEESETNFQYIHLALEQLLTDAEKRKRLRATAEAPLSEKHLAKLFGILKRVRERLKGNPCKRLLGCIQQVMQMRKQNRFQLLLQHMFLVHEGLTDNAPCKIPSGMEIPRTTMEVTSRMQHFERIRDQGHNVVHYVHPAQSRTGTPLMLSSADSRTSTPSRPLRLRDARSLVAQCSRAGTPGTVSEMAAKARTFGRIGLQSDVTMVGEEVKFAEDWETCFAACLGKSRRASVESGLSLDLPLHPKQNEDAKRKRLKQKGKNKATRVIEYGSEPPPPELSGATGEFMSYEKKSLVKSLVRDDKAVNSLPHEESDAGDHRHKKAKAHHSRKQPRLPLFNHLSLHGDAGETNRPILRSSSCLSSLSSELAGRTQDLGSNLKAKSTGALTANVGVLPTCSSKLDDRDAEARKKALYNVHFNNFTQYFMQSRGLEQAPTSTNDDFRRLLRKVVRPRPESPIHSETAFPRSSLWAGIGNMSMMDRCTTPEVAYARECHNEKVSPSIVKFLAEPSSKLDLGEYHIGDADLQALLNALMSQQISDGSIDAPPKSPITDISFAGNRRLSDEMLSRFLTTAILGDKKAGSKPCVGLVTSLNLADCTGFRCKSLNTMCSLLSRGNELRNLEELNIQGIEIAATAWTKMTESFRVSLFLRKLGLARTGCGRLSQQNCRDVAHLIVSGACKSLRSLDISGNHFHHEGCVALGDALKKADDKFEEFDLSHNAGLASDLNNGEETPSREQTSFKPIMHVLEALGETTVKRVAFADCQLMYEEDCILEDAVDSSDITHLDLSGNPHGEQGLGCIFRLLARKRQSAQQIEYVGLDIIRNSPLQPDTVKYDFVDPSAEYSLCLRNPQHRSILKLLLKRSENCGGHFSCFHDAKLDGKVIQNGLQCLCSKRMDRGGDDWQTPCNGVLTFAFHLPLCYNPRDDLKDVFRKFERGRKLKLDFHGFSRLLRVYGTLHDQRSQMVALSAMSRDIVFKVCHIQYISEKSYLFAFTIVTLLPTLEQHTSRGVLFELINSAGVVAHQIRLDAKSLLYFNALHPDNHYELNLSNLADRGTAQRCLVISSWVRNQSIALGRLDLSQYGNCDCIRHASLSREKFIFDSETWQLPDEGVLAFDMVLPRLPLNAKECLDEHTVEDLIKALIASPCKFEHKLRALRLIAHRIVLTPKSLKRILQQFPCVRPDSPVATTFGFRPRVEAYVVLYNRTLYHSLVVSPAVLFNGMLFYPAESQEIRDRLGWIHTFDAVNVHSALSNLGNRHGPLDMHSHDGWLVVKLLLTISYGETSLNFADCRWSPKESLMSRGYAFCIPKEWLPNPPRYGHFTCSFVSRTEEIDWLRRDELAVTHLGWTYPPSAGTPSKK